MEVDRMGFVGGEPNVDIVTHYPSDHFFELLFDVPNVNDVPGYEHIPGRYGVEIERTDSGTSTFVPLRPDLAALDGSLRIAAVLMGIDMGAGITAGQAVLPGWTVTADIETHLVGRCTVGPLRVDARAIKPGRTMSVVECRVVDAGAADQLVALATANHGVLEPTFDDDLRHDGRWPSGIHAANRP